MADIISKHYLHPNNYQDSPPATGGFKEIIFNIKCLSDGTGETDVIKLDLSKFTKSDGTIPTKMSILSIEGIINGLNLLLEFDRTPHKEIFRINSSGGTVGINQNWENEGGFCDPSDGTDGTGNLLLSTSSVTAGDGYDLTIKVKIK